MSENEITLIDDAPRAVAAVPRATGSTPGDLLVHAMNSGASMEQLEKLLDLQMRHEANEARKAYVDDMAKFKLNPPTILKDKTVAFSGTRYNHATLGAVTQAVAAGLAQHGFSHRWDTQQDKGEITVSCIITHRLGHRESIQMTDRPDDSGKKNAIQQVASAITYLQRYTLLAATGVATMDESDDDGRGAGPAPAAPEKHSIVGPRFDQALAAIRAKDYTPEEMRSYYALTPDQETALADVEKELA